jgi:hypothetical protein
MLVCLLFCEMVATYLALLEIPGDTLDVSENPDREP